MKLIVGLGNPGIKYEVTRHNAGFFVVDRIAVLNKARLRKDKSLSYVGRVKAGAEIVCLAKPLSYMNLSGKPVKSLKKELKIEIENLLVICDDADLPVGAIRFRSAGSSGGHNGLKSIIEELGTKDFSRLKIGIGRPYENEALEDYVLKPIAKKEKSILVSAVSLAAEAALFWAEHDIFSAMNRFNNRKTEMTDK
ncbi:MAG: aminoacyl-tRNA hydrolase [Candidatus Omnitrophota bacterium]